MKKANPFLKNIDKKTNPFLKKSNKKTNPLLIKKRKSTLKTGHKTEIIYPDVPSSIKKGSKVVVEWNHFYGRSSFTGKVKKINNDRITIANDSKVIFDYPLYVLDKIKKVK